MFGTLATFSSVTYPRPLQYAQVTWPTATSGFAATGLTIDSVYGLSDGGNSNVSFATFHSTSEVPGTNYMGSWSTVASGESQAFMNGRYIVTGSSTSRPLATNSNAAHHPFQAFPAGGIPTTEQSANVYYRTDFGTGTFGGYFSISTQYPYQSGTGALDATYFHKTPVGGGFIAGEYLTVQTPYAQNVSNIEIYNPSVNGTPTSLSLVGSNDNGASWQLVGNASVTVGNARPAYAQISGTGFYNTHRIIFNSVSQYNSVLVGKMYLTGNAVFLN